MKRELIVGVVLSGILMFTGASALRAEGPGMDKGTHGACKADAEKLCPGVKPGHGDVRDCLKQHESELSAGCKSNIAEMKEKMEKRKAELQTACKADLDQFCKDITPGEGREMACLHAHSDKISAGCKETLHKDHPRMHGMMEKK